MRYFYASWQKSCVNLCLTLNAAAQSLYLRHSRPIFALIAQLITVNKEFGRWGMNSESEEGKRFGLNIFQTLIFMNFTFLQSVGPVLVLSTCCCHMFGPSVADYLVISLRQRPSRSLISTLAFSSAVTLLPRWSPGGV